jgi:hypothetical protein
MWLSKRCIAKEHFMDDHYIVTAFVIIDDFLTTLGHKTHPLATVTDAEVLTVAVVASKFFGNNHKNALAWMKAARFIPDALDLTRFSRRLALLADWLELLLETIGKLSSTGLVYIIDSMPLPVCQRVRAMRCKKVRGREFCGYCAAKKQKFFGCGSARKVHLRTKKAFAFGLRPKRCACQF